jgi:hypothetical protein
MPFLPPENATYINVKLTDAGRRMLSFGQLQFSKAVISDREIDYNIDRKELNGLSLYNISNNRVLSPVGDYPNVDPLNLDGSQPIQLTNQTIQSIKQFATAQTATYGMFSGYTNNWSLFANPEHYLTKGNRITAGIGTDTITINSYSNPSTYTVKTGDTLFIPWATGDYPSSSPFNNNNLMYSGGPFNGMFYSVYSTITNTQLVLDRTTPDLASNVFIPAFIYPKNAVETYFGSGSTQQTKMWNMNIVRPYDVVGTDLGVEGVSGYSSYGSIQYAGTKHYLGFDESYPALGIIHYTNKFSGLTYGEQFIEKSIILNMPTIMWHNFPANNGEGIEYGLTLYDNYGSTQYDSVAKTTYRDLRDGIQSTNKVVGRVYHKLQLFVITDQDLLMTMTYKGNRSYTLPEPIVSLVSNPKAPLTTSQVAGLCESGKTYFVTYLVESDIGGTYSFGYTNPIHCGYIKQIDGNVDVNGNPQYLSFQFPTNSFPYMRNDAAIVNTGTGWNAQRVKILVNEQEKSYDYMAGNVPADNWVIMSGQGIFDCTTATVPTNTIDPVALNSYQFIMSKADYNSGATAGNYIMWSGHTSNQRVLNFGDESFFFGTIDAQIFTTTYKTIMTVVAANYEYNSSINDTFNSLTDDYTYITEVAILDEQNNTVAVGKPTYPLKKANSRYLAFQLIIDF